MIQKNIQILELNKNILHALILGPKHYIDKL